MTTEGVTQTILHNPDTPSIRGNCVQAAVASWFCLSGWDTGLDDVPDMANSVLWWEQLLYGYFALRGYLLRFRGLKDKPIPDELCLLTGQSARGVGHMVVGGEGRIVWDPHPSRSGLVTVGGAYIPRRATEVWAIVDLSDAGGVQP